MFSPIAGEMIQFEEHIFQMGWFNHQLDIGDLLPSYVGIINQCKDTVLKQPVFNGNYPAGFEYRCSSGF